MNLAAHMRYKESYLCTDEFKALGIYDQASQILENQDLLEVISDEAIEMMTTILIKSMCVCNLLEHVPDELTGRDNIVLSGRHTKSCPAFRIPVIEDLSVSQIQRRQKRELLLDNRSLLNLEETSLKIKRKEKYGNNA